MDRPEVWIRHPDLIDDLINTSAVPHHPLITMVRDTSIEEYWRTKATCRQGLLTYLDRALSPIPTSRDLRILDAGCGLGVTTLHMTQRLKGTIVGVDPDLHAMAFLQERVQALGLHQRISLFVESLFAFESHQPFDLILAEGLLNVVGFKAGFEKLLSLAKRGGYIILHDDCQEQSGKLSSMSDHHCSLIDSFVLDEVVWWNHYYQCLEREINSCGREGLLALFKTERKEIAAYKKDSSPFQSMYYVIRRN